MDSTNCKVLITLMGMEIGGAETHVLELCKALVKKGADVYVASNGGAYERELLDNGIKHFRVPLHNKKLRNIFSSYRLLKKIIVQNDIKLVHAHARIPAFLCGLLQKRLKFCFVTTAHLDFRTTLPYKILTDWGDASLAVSEDIKQYLIDNYKIKPEKIIVTINGIDTEKFSASGGCSEIIDEFSLDVNKRRIVYISRMDKDRSLAAHKLIECAEDIYAFDNNVEIIIVGGGNDFDDVKLKADEVNKKLGVNFITLTNGRTDINKLIACADIFVGASRAVLEAMSAEKPVIVAGNQGYIGIFDQTKLETAISTNFCCRGCEPTAKENLRKDLIALLSMEKPQLNSLGNYGREVIKQYYSVDKMADDALALYEMAMKAKREIDVIISGYYGFNNHGDDTLLKAITDDLRAQNENINILVLSKRPKQTQKLYGVKSISRINFPVILKKLKRTKLLISGAGSLIQDVTSTKSLIYYLFVINLALKCGAKVMLYANGIGPLRLEKNKKRAAAVLNRVDLITLRESSSGDVLRELNVTAPAIYVTADPAFCIKNTEPQSAQKMLDRIGIGERKYFCVAVRSWKTLNADFESHIAQFCSHIKENYGYEALFISMQPVNDEEISKKIISLIKGGAYYLGNDFSINEILGITAGCEFMLGMRLHTVIYAAKAGTPVIGLVYDPKVLALMEQFSQPYHLEVEKTDSEILIQFADEVINNRQSISAAISEKSNELAQLAEKNAIMAYELINKEVSF